MPPPQSRGYGRQQKCYTFKCIVIKPVSFYRVSEKIYSVYHYSGQKKRNLLLCTSCEENFELNVFIGQ